MSADTPPFDAVDIRRIHAHELAQETFGKGSGYDRIFTQAADTEDALDGFRAWLVERSETLRKLMLDKSRTVDNRRITRKRFDETCAVLTELDRRRPLSRDR